MAETNVLSQIKALTALQKLDGEIYDLKRELKEKPAYLAEIQKAFDEKKGALKASEEKYKALQVKRNSLETDLKTKEAAVAKANVQLSEIQTNREYTAKISEIASLKADQSIIEEKILISYDEADGIKGEVDQEKNKLAEEEKNFLSQKKQIDDSIKILEERVRTLEGQRKQIAPNVDKSTLVRYERILANKGGKAIVSVHHGSCGACFFTCPQQVINEIRMHSHLVFCEQCGVILYLEEDVS